MEVNYMSTTTALILNSNTYEERDIGFVMS